ncbi:leucine-rich repeat protein [uncultured Treponema sp.]|uniref:leucine-rich repeat protein n=1 Tax=uncultured Treponema sp. TaxID=162155 RepID=UPI0025FA51BC|nr:leucine-rich repeat protein [uncultured Treponema sp.]
MKAKFLRLFSILAVCGLFFCFPACQTESGDGDSSSKKTEETKTEETKNDGTKTDDTQTGGQNTQTGKYKITYKLSYELNKNTVPSSSTYKTIYFDEPYTITEDDLAIPEPKSYMTGEEWVFNGWWNQSSFISTKLTLGETIDASITVSGFWRTRYSRNLSYYSKYDSEHCPQNTTVKENEVLTEEKLPELSCEGHNFKGWWTTIYSDGESKEIPITSGYRIPIEGNVEIHLTAKWDQTVSFSTEYGTAPEAISVPTGTSFEKLAEMLTEDTYILTDEAGVWGFVGWEGKTSSSGRSQLLTPDNEDLSSYYWRYHINEDITLTARWLKKCTVTFETERGVAPEAISGFYGSYAQLAETLSADNYKLTDDEGLRDFLGWKYNGRLLNLEAEENWSYSGNLEDDITVTAQWQKKKCTITFVTEHGTTPEPVVVDGGTSMDKISEIYSDEKYKLTAEGYDFWGWSSYNYPYIKYKGDYVICDDMQSVAAWKAKSYTVTFEANEPTKGKNSSTNTYDYDSLIEWPPSVSKEGYKLEGWYLDEAFKQKWNFETDVVKGDMTLYAKWIFTIKFNAKGGNGTMEDQVFTYGIEEELHKNAFTIDKAHYTFIGWSRSISSLYSYIYGAKIYSDCELISSSISSDGRYSEVSLYALWVNDCAAQIWTMTASGTIKPDFDLTNEMLEEIGSVLKKLYETRPDIKVSLDLSEQTQITEIGYYAFKGCANLTSINIPDSVTWIDDGAFEGCTSLTDVLIPNAVNTIRLSAFKNCANLTSINIPDSVTWIGDWAFENCTSLTSINIPDSVTEIGDYAFNGCSSLESIAIPFVGNNINDTVDGGSSVFAQIFGSRYYPAANNSNIPTSLKSVTVNSGIIPDYAFKDCSSIESIVIKGNPAKIGSSAFSGCTSLTSINIPDSVTEIGSSAFYDCASLTSVNIPDSVTEIGDYAFNGCSKLSKINIPTNVSKIGWTAFYDCTSLTDVLIPNAITEIGWGAFENCENLTSINIPASVIKIYSNTFSGCEKLTIKIEDENSTWNYEYYKDSTKITGKTRLVNFNLVYWSKVNNGSSVATLTKIIQ